jgi:outer membrane lipoprotein carrier protein
MRCVLCLLFQLLILAQGLAEQPVLENWLKRQATTTSLDCNFIQERQLPALKNPTVTRGRLVFSKPGKFRWQLGEPVESLAVSDGKTLTLVQFREKTAHQIAADSPQAARFSLLSGKAFESLEAFQQTFEIIETRINSGIHQFTLKPKDRRMRSQVPWVFLDIDPLKNELSAMEIELQDKSRIRTVFKTPRFNQPLPDSLFTADLSGIKVE